MPGQGSGRLDKRAGHHLKSQGLKQDADQGSGCSPALPTQHGLTQYGGDSRMFRFILYDSSCTRRDFAIAERQPVRLGHRCSRRAFTSGAEMPRQTVRTSALGILRVRIPAQSDRREGDGKTRFARENTDGNAINTNCNGPVESVQAD